MAFPSQSISNWSLGACSFSSCSMETSCCTSKSWDFWLQYLPLPGFFFFFNLKWLICTKGPFPKERDEIARNHRGPCLPRSPQMACRLYWLNWEDENVEGSSLLTAAVFNLRIVMSKHIISDSVSLRLYCLIWSHLSFMVIFHQLHWTFDLTHHTLTQSAKYPETPRKPGKTDVRNRRSTRRARWRYFCFSFPSSSFLYWKPQLAQKGWGPGSLLL